VKRVYLDQNKWVDLARARMGRDDGKRFLDAWLISRAMVHAGDASFPLSSVHYMEVSHRRRWDSRWSLAATMADLSQFHAITQTVPLLRAELDRAVGMRVGSRPPPRRVQVFGFGIQHAFAGALPAVDVPDQNRFGWEMAMLAGVPPEIEGQLEGYDPTRHRQVGRDFAASQQGARERREQEGWHQGDRAWRAAQAETILAHLPEVNDAFDSSGVGVSRWMGSLERDGKFALDEAEAFLADIPLLFVEAELRRLRSTATSQPWEDNDLRDLDALCRAVVYCDIVVTENQWAQLIHRAHLDDRYGTTVLRDVADLPAHLV
jgi:hypothetical protein